MSTFTPSAKQRAAISQVVAWHKELGGSDIFRLFGFAGTGKTSIAQEIARKIPGRVLFAAFTGKAALQLRKKDCEDASTIHSLIYKVDQDDDTGSPIFTLNKDSDLVGASLLIVDEVSMVGEELARDLLSYGVKILVLGDPAQLPPVRDEGFFINAAPDVMLTEVQRQALDNPIVRLSMDIREGRGLKPGRYGESLVVARSAVGQDELRDRVLGEGQVLCGLNRTRVSYNRRIRDLKGLRGRQSWHPALGDRLICLRNNREKHFFNGGLWDVTRVADKFGRFDLVLRSLDVDRPLVDAQVLDEFFSGNEASLDWVKRRESDEFTFGWAITCHKSQGSEWDDVLVFDESGAFRESRSNWLYTAVTRASERVTVIV